MPRKRLKAALAEHGIDPIRLAEEFNTDLPTVFRRIAFVGEQDMGLNIGLVVCDASGSILFRKPVAGFALPRHGASCPLWPLFTALSRPLVPIRRRVSQLGRTAAQFDCFAVAWPEKMPGFDEDPVFRSIMMILPLSEADAEGPNVQPVGSNCRVCPRDSCVARREPSILSDGLG